MSKYQHKYDRHREICNDLNAMYEFKNERYGNSFGNTFQDLGPISALTRMSDKFNRLKELMKNPDIDAGDESVLDTLADMANYCIMTMIELEEMEPEPEVGADYGVEVIAREEPPTCILNTFELEQNKDSFKQCILCRYNNVKGTTRTGICYECYDFDQFERAK